MTAPSRAAAILALALLVSGCAARRPVLYPNAQLQRVGAAAAQEDIEACVAAARAADLDADPAVRTAKSTAVSGATGAAVGAAVGAVRGRPGRGAAAGAAGGGAAGFMRGLFRWRDPDPLEVRYVNFCLQDLGYRVLGWR